MIRHFAYTAMPGRVVFGPGSLDRLGEEVERLGARKVLVLSTPGQRSLAESVADGLGTRAAGIFDQAVMHVPVEIAAAARDEAQRLGADACVAVGGGSTIGLAKAIALEIGPSDCRRTDDLRGLRNDADLGPDCGRRQADRARSKGASPRRDL